MPRVKSSYHIKLYKLWFFFQGEAVVQFLSIRSHFRGYLTIVGWVKCIWFLCVQLLFSLGQKPHSLFAVHGCGHVIANLSPCFCKLTSKPENGVQWVVSSNSSYASQLVKSDCFKIKSFKVVFVDLRHNNLCEYCCKCIVWEYLIRCKVHYGCSSFAIPHRSII